MLVLFAQQAAAARAHREEQCVQADGEALFETCPVGVPVLDATTGAVISLNQEVCRILAGRAPEGRSLQLVWELMVCRRGYRREVRLGDLDNAEVVRAE